jgi:amino acid permease
VASIKSIIMILKQELSSMSSLEEEKKEREREGGQRRATSKTATIVNGDEEGRRRNTNLLKAVFNLTKSAIGLGALFLPGNVRRMGLVGGALMIAVGALTSGASLHLLSRLAHHYNVGDYFELGMAAFGPRMALLDTVMLVVFQLGGLIAYTKFAGSYLSSGIQLFIVLRDPEAATPSIPWWRGYQFLSVVLSAVLIFPLSLLGDLSILGYTSLAGMLCILYNAVLTVVDFAMAAAKGQLDRSLYTMFRFRSDFLSSFASIMFAFVNQFTVVALMPVLKRPTTARRATLVGSSSSIVTAVYMAMGLCGYLHFGDLVPEDILSASVSTWYAVGRLLVSVILIVSYPLQLAPTRSACDHLFLQCLGGKEGKVRSWLRTRNLFRHAMWTVLLVALPCVIAVSAVQYVQPLLELTSSACGATLVYILPAVYFLQLTHSLRFLSRLKKPRKNENDQGDKEDEEKEREGEGSQHQLLIKERKQLEHPNSVSPLKAKRAETIAAYILLVFGVVVCIGGTVGAFIVIIGNLIASVRRK